MILSDEIEQFNILKEVTKDYDIYVKYGKEIFRERS